MSANTVVDAQIIVIVPKIMNKTTPSLYVFRERVLFYCHLWYNIYIVQKGARMANNIKNQQRPRWTNSEVKSLELWYNQGMSIDEIARKLNRSFASVNGALSNRRGTMNLQVRRGKKSAPVSNMNVAVEERRKNTRHIMYDLQQTDLIVIIKSVMQLGESHFQARLLMAKQDLSQHRGVNMAEFTSLQACLKWFETEIELWKFD